MWPCQSIFLPTENCWPGSNWSIGGGGRRRFRSARRRWNVLTGSATAGSREHGGGRRGRRQRNSAYACEIGSTRKCRRSSKHHLSSVARVIFLIFRDTATP